MSITQQVRGRWLSLRHLVAICFCVSFVGIFSGSQIWTGLHTPDSEFYFSLGTFGDAVTTRAPTPAYYWTRLAEIAPLRLLNVLFSPTSSWFVYRLILIAVICVSIYLTLLHANTQLVVVTALTVTIGTNTTVLYFLGDTYVTGTALTWTFAGIALQIAWLKSERLRFQIEIALGGVFSLLMFCNPTAALLFSAVVVSTVLSSISDLARYLRSIVCLSLRAATGALAVFGLFLIASQLLFPELNWTQTVRYYANVLRSSDYASRSVGDWLWTEYSLLVPALALLLSLGFVVSQRPRKLSSRIVLIPSVPPLLAAAIVMKSGGPLLEASYYSSLLWPYGLATLALFLAKSIAPNERENLSRLGSPLLTSILCIATALMSRAFGQFRFELSGSQIIAALVACAVTFAFLFLVERVPLRKICVAGALVAFPSFQLLQNGRPAIAAVVPRQDYSLSFRGSTTRDIVYRNVRVQQWLLSQTGPTDRILVYGDIVTNQVSAAAMQLWGPNAASSGSAPSDWDQRNLEVVDPTVIVSYFPWAEGSQLRRKFFMDNLLAGRPLQASAQCGIFPQPIYSPIEVCLHRLSQSQ